MESFFFTNLSLKLVSNKTHNESLNISNSNYEDLLFSCCRPDYSPKPFSALLGRWQAKTSFSMLLQLNPQEILVMADNFNSMIHIVIIWQLGDRILSPAKWQQNSDQ